MPEVEDPASNVAASPVPEFDTPPDTDTELPAPESDDPAANEACPPAELVPVVNPSVMDTAPAIPLNADQHFLHLPCASYHLLPFVHFAGMRVALHVP